MKLCTTCNIAKGVELFSLATKNKDGRQSMCKLCAKQFQVDWRARNIVAIRAHDVERGKGDTRKAAKKMVAKRLYAASRQAVIARTRAYQVAHPEMRKAAFAKWRKANLEVMAELVRRYYAQRLKAYPTWADPQAILSFYAHSKAMSLATGVKHHVDHIVPINSKIVCGLHNEFNLRVIPAVENMSKGNRYWPDMPGN